MSERYLLTSLTPLLAACSRASSTRGTVAVSAPVIQPSELVQMLGDEVAITMDKGKKAIEDFGRRYFHSLRTLDRSVRDGFDDFS